MFLGASKLLAELCPQARLLLVSRLGNLSLSRTTPRLGHSRLRWPFSLHSQQTKFFLVRLVPLPPGWGKLPWPAWSFCDLLDSIHQLLQNITNWPLPAPPPYSFSCLKIGQTRKMFNILCGFCKTRLCDGF